MSAVIAGQQARLAAEKRKKEAAEKAKKDKRKAQAAALKKQAAAEEAASKFSSPEEEKAAVKDFMTRVEAAERRDEAAADTAELLKDYFGDKFADADGDANGSLTFDEFKLVMSELAASFSDRDVRAAFIAADKNGDGTVDSKEFLRRAPQYMTLAEQMLNMQTAEASATGGGLTKEEIKEAKALLKKCDVDNDGNLDFDEFKMAMQKIAPGLDDKQLRQAFAAVDSDGSGGLAIEEFVEGQVELKKWKQKRKPKKGEPRGSAKPKR